MDPFFNKFELHDAVKTQRSQKRVFLRFLKDVTCTNYLFNSSNLLKAKLLDESKTQS
jgi:hypothetical protein